eukprot:scaffold1302_cov114-Isochrysis_galbana.AAC.6
MTDHTHRRVPSAPAPRTRRLTPTQSPAPSTAALRWPSRLRLSVSACWAELCATQDETKWWVQTAEAGSSPWSLARSRCSARLTQPSQHRRRDLLAGRQAEQPAQRLAQHRRSSGEEDGRVTEQGRAGAVEQHVKDDLPEWMARSRAED